MVGWRRVLSCAVLTAGLSGIPAIAQEQSDKIALMPVLTPQRLHRLRLEKDRQTIRWGNFASRVETVPDSSQRGFELALYYAVTQDEQWGKEAVAWAVSHPNDARQRAIVANWCGDLVSTEQRSQWSAAGTTTAGLERDTANESTNDQAALLLLSREPEEFNQPSWQTHIKALRLVANNPNLPNVQFLQSWVLQPDQMLRNGPGVGYEFFWADPYLPGVSYHNMEPWIYTNGHLFARSDWTPRACWVAISSASVQDQNCPQDWRAKPITFGRLTLMPAEEKCTDAGAGGVNGTRMLWHLTPGEKMTYRDDKKKRLTTDADSAGLLRLPNNFDGKMCPAR
jgi:hypothetical protein